MQDHEVLKKVCEGTDYERLKNKPVVLYNDGMVALVKHLHNWTYKVPSWVDLYSIQSPTYSCGVWRGKEVWNSEDNGYLTKKRLVRLVLDLGLDPYFIREK